MDSELEFLSMENPVDSELDVCSITIANPVDSELEIISTEKPMDSECEVLSSENPVDSEVEILFSESLELTNFTLFFSFLFFKLRNEKGSWHLFEVTHVTHIWVILLKTGQNGDLESRNIFSYSVNLFLFIIWKWKLDISCVHKYQT